MPADGRDPRSRRGLSEADLSGLSEATYRLLVQLYVPVGEIEEVLPALPLPIAQDQ